MESWPVIFRIPRRRSDVHEYQLVPRLSTKNHAKPVFCFSFEGWSEFRVEGVLESKKVKESAQYLEDSEANSQLGPSFFSSRLKPAETNSAGSLKQPIETV